MLNIFRSVSAEEKQRISEKHDFEQAFYRLMFELNLYNKSNRTYYLSIEEKTKYGFFAKLYLVPGLSFEELQKQIDKVQEGLCCIWLMQNGQLQDYTNIKIITKPVDLSIAYRNPCLKPWELYLGLDLSQNDNKIDVNDHHMFLLTGAIGAGKTRFIYTILLSWILGCAVNEVEIYLSDIAKNEFVNFQYVKHVRYYASEIEQLYKMMQYIEIRVAKRKKALDKAREEGWATNIKEYNKNSKFKMSYIYIVIDEFSVVVPDRSDNKNETEMKQYILDILKKISKIGRSLGIFCFIALQKSTKEEMGISIIKNMAAVRISFRANDSVSSEVVLGDSSAVGLADRYAIYSLNGGDKKDLLFSPYITTEHLNELLKPHIDKKFKKVDVETEIKITNQKPQPPSKIISITDKKPKNQHYDTYNSATTDYKGGDGYSDY